MAASAGDGTEERIDWLAFWRDLSPAIALTAGFTGVIVSILAGGLVMVGAINDMRLEILREFDSLRVEIRSLR